MAEEEEKNVETSEEKIVSKHKQSGKHSLQYDTIFKGKKEGVDEDTDTSTTYHNDTFTHDPSSNYYHETINNHDYIRERELKQKVYDILIEHTDINFLNNRRKPSRVGFNEYYRLLKIHLNGDNFTSIEVFNELAYYFSDNLFNMLKLLDNNWRDLIMSELQEHIGKKPDNSKVVNHKNLCIDAEVEFYINDIVTGNEVIITGVIKEIIIEEVEDKANNSYKPDYTYVIDSYENIYNVKIEDIEEILNNTKFKYNLNKLNHIDFL